MKNYPTVKDAGLYGAMQRLKQRNRQLINDNKRMAQLLNAKRYKATDLVVDSFYSVIKKPREKFGLLERNLDAIERPEEENNVQLREWRPVRGRVDIINVSFYDWEGKAIFKGGAERYVYDLARLLKERGYTPRILQCSSVEFEKKYHGIKVIGLGGGTRGDIRENSWVFSYYCRDAEFIIASPLELACEIRDVPVIGINHGVNFDGVWNEYNEDYPHLYNEHIDALRNVASCVCVDTNFINWTRTQDYALALKEKYIPNYYDAKEFKVKKARREDGKITFVYPRRLYEARGFDITVEAFRALLPKYKKKVILKFVGQVDNKKVKGALADIMTDFPENVFHEEYTMDEMPKAYEEADVVLVPTRYCEGTSLSCIEGMASGAAILVTDVGGLPNLVIDGYNGMIVSPTAEGLKEGVEKLIKDVKLRERLAANGKEVAMAAFSKSMWEEKWKKVIEDVRG